MGKAKFLTLFLENKKISNGVKRQVLTVKFYENDEIEESLLKYAVVLAGYNGK